MLHRGAYRLPGDAGPAAVVGKRFWLARFLDINEDFTKGD